MTARSFLLLPIFALSVALAGCDSGAPAPDGLQASPTVPTASSGTLSGTSEIQPYCYFVWTYSGPENLNGSYWGSSSLVSVTPLSPGVARLTAGGSPGAFGVQFYQSGGTLLASRSGHVTSTGECGPD